MTCFGVDIFLFFLRRPLSAKQMLFAPQRAEYVLNTLQSLQIREANLLLRGKSTEEGISDVRKTGIRDTHNTSHR